MNLEPRDHLEITGITRKQRNVVREGGRCDECIECFGPRCAASSSQTARDQGEVSGACIVKWQWIESRLDMLDDELTCVTVLRSEGHMWSHTEFSQSDGADRRIVRQRGLFEFAELDDHTRIQQASGRL